MGMSLTRQVFVVDSDDEARAVSIGAVRRGGLPTRGLRDAGSLVDLEPDVPAVAVLYVRPSDENGPSGFRRSVERLCDRLGVVVVADFLTVDQAVELMKLGAVDILQAPVGADALAKVIEEAFEVVLERRERQLRQEANLARFKTLTPRERQVLALRLEGCTSKETGDFLELSHRTVEIFRASMMKKLEARSVADLHLIVRDIEGVGQGATLNMGDTLGVAERRLGRTAWLFGP